VAWSAIAAPVGEKGDGQGMDEAQMREVWLYWDMAPLMRYMKSDVVASRDGKSEVGIRSLFPGRYGKFLSESKLTA
jgi:hypothetical protein